MSTLDAVRVPPELEPLFQKAEAYVRAYFAEQRAEPSQGTLEFHGERYIRIRASSISIEFFDLVRHTYGGSPDADEVARSLLFDVAHAIGVADARDFRRQMGVVEPMDALSAGPVHFAYTGWALVDIASESAPSPDDDYVLVYSHPNSFEADAWLKEGRTAGSPVCVMNAGYSSGWSEESFGIPLVAREMQCRAQGHTSCHFVMAPPHRLADRIAEYAARHPDRPVAARAGPRFFEQLRRRDAALARAQRMESVGLLAGGIAHDFNNLLTVILGCAESLELSLSDGAERKNAEAIIDAAERASQLTRQLVALSREQELDLVVVDLPDLLRELEPHLRELTVGHTLVLDPLPVVRVAADPRSLEQLVTNLVSNAADAQEPGGHIQVGIEVRGQECTLFVADEGPGMSDVVEDRAFEPFFTTRPGRSGLGLPIARGIVDQLAGSIELMSTPDGTRVEVVLPCTERAVPHEAPTDSRDVQGAVVLVVEDDDAIRSMLARFLPSYGYTVYAASSAPAARQLAQGLERLDLVLSDILMPDADGPSAVAGVLEHHPAAAVLFMTGYAERRVEGLPANAGVIRKPFTLEAVHSRLTALLGDS